MTQRNGFFRDVKEILTKIDRIENEAIRVFRRQNNSPDALFMSITLRIF